MIQIHDVEQGTPEWHTLREDLYTGSNAHKLLRFGTINYSRSTATGFKGNFYTKRGHILEDEAIELYEAINGRSVSRPGFITNTDFLACGYSPDGIDADYLLEVKCFNEKKHRTIAKGEIPLEIMAQIQFGLVISGLRKARLILYNPDIEDASLCLIVLEVKYNRNVHNNFKRILSAKEVSHGQ